MSQFEMPILVEVDPTGINLAEAFDRWNDALRSNHRGAARPIYAVAGMAWVQEMPDVGGVPQPDRLMFFDGVNDHQFPGLGSDIEATTLGGENADFYRNASNLNDGQIAHGLVPKADQGQAEAGTSDDVFVTPVSAHQAITRRLPNGSGGSGWFVNINTQGANWALPSGGTWVYSYTGFTGSNQSYIHHTGFAAGGSVIFPAAGSSNIARGFAWRIA